jgi:S-adenosylmethionine hydrolase
MTQSNEVMGYRVSPLDISKTQFQSIVVTGNAVNRRISFPDEFGSFCTAVVIDNRDGLNNLTYRLNSDITTPKTIGPSETETISDARIVLIDIIGGGSNNWEVQAQVYPRQQTQVTHKEFI